MLWLKDLLKQGLLILFFQLLLSDFAISTSFHLPTAALQWHLLEKAETENPQTAFCWDPTTLKIVAGICFLLTEVEASRSFA